MAKEIKTRSSVWRNFIHLIKTIKLPFVLLIIVFLLNLGRAAIQLLIPEKTGSISTIVLESGGDAVHLAVSICLTLFALALVEFVGSLVATYITNIAKAQMNRDFQKVASRKAFLLKAADIEAKDPKEFISRITTDTEFVSEFIIDLLVNEIPRLYFIISTIVRVASMGNGSLVLGFILVVPVIIVGSLWSGRVTYKAQNKLQAIIAQLTAKLAEKVNNIETIKAYNKSEDEMEAGGAAIDEMKKAQKKTTWAAAFNTLISNILFIVPTLIIMLIGAIQLLNKTITTQEFITYFGLGATYQTYIAAHLTLWVLAKRAQGATQRISEVLLLEEDRGGGGKAENPGTIEFRNVSFSYGDSEILSDVSFVVKPGSKTAIVGKSGSGKSTILNLIEQFYRPEKGSILLDGTDVTTLETSSYRNLFAYLPQNAPGFSGTVREMLAYGAKKEHTDEEYRDILQKIGLLDSIGQLGGLDYEVGTNAAKLSGGQRQRLAVARMLLQDAKIVLADEATSALDTDGARRISELIDEYAADKTRIIVAHDLSTITNADQIIVLDHGKIADCGTHQELEIRCDLYRSFLNAGKED
ncbi:MAG: ABC transporter ATP-binding protein [Clostridia bacterium]|nr:ABC transporter ATP-binding protein [Clostridia bacterium]